MPTVYRRSSHSVFLCDYHLVFPTKYRRKVINNGIKAFIIARIETIHEHYPQIQFKKINTDKDHIHLLVSIPPAMSVGKVVGIIKQNTARNMKAEFLFSKRFTGAPTVFGRKATFAVRLASTRGSSDAISKTKAKPTKGKTTYRCFEAVNTPTVRSWEVYFGAKVFRECWRL